MWDVIIGIYEHYKGKKYEVIGVWIHTETNEEYVVYRSLYASDDYPIWSIRLRPKTMFLESICIETKTIPRFRYIWKI